MSGKPATNGRRPTTHGMMPSNSDTHARTEWREVQGTVCSQQTYVHSVGGVLHKYGYHCTVAASENCILLVGFGPLVVTLTHAAVTTTTRQPCMLRSRRTLRSSQKSAAAACAPWIYACVHANARMRGYARSLCSVAPSTYSTQSG